MTDDAAVRRELDQLAGWLTRLEGRVGQIDMTGTRGMAAVTVQITDIAKDVVELRGEQQAWERAHEHQHAAEQGERVKGRRWLISIGVAGVTALAGLYPLVTLLATRH